MSLGAATFLAIVAGALAANPLIKDVSVCAATGGAGGMCGVADTNVHYFDGRFMLFATHDFSVNNTGFRMDDWQVWSSADLVSWSLESIVMPQESLKWDKQVQECWATDAAFTSGKYYFYVSAGGGQVGVMSAASPKGPWSDPIGKPLMSTALGKSLSPPTTFRDPCVFQEPGTQDFYIVAGVFTYYVTKLGADMVSLGEKPRLVNFTNHVYGPCGDGKTDDKPFMHKQGNTYYLSWGCFYATGPSVYGPFTMQGAVIDTAKIARGFQCDGQAHQCGKAAAAAAGHATVATAPQLARAEALARYEQRTPAQVSSSASAARSTGARAPQAGDSIMLVKCAGTPAAATGWTQKRGAAHWAAGQPFQIALSSDPSLCIQAGRPLTLQRCDNSSSAAADREASTSPSLGKPAAAAAEQMFERKLTGHGGANGDDIVGPNGTSSCPCWNVAVSNAGDPQPKRAGEIVQCYACIDGPPAAPTFNKKQRFEFPAGGGSGQIQAWAGWAKGYCVAAVVPPAKPWYLEEDYTDRHGSFVQHAQQWYYFSNDRSHSGDVGREGSFRDTVGCYIHFHANNTMESCVVNAQGVNQHDLSAGRALEAEEFFSLQGGGGSKVDLLHSGGGDGFAVGGGHGTLLRYPHVTGIGSSIISGSGALTLRVATSGTGSTLEIRANSSSAAALASCALPATSGLDRFADVVCPLDAGAAASVGEWEVELLLSVRSERLAAGGEALRIDRFALS